MTSEQQQHENEEKSFTIRHTPTRVTGDFDLFEGDRRREDIRGERAIRVSRKSKHDLWDYLDQLDSDPRVYNEEPRGEYEELTPT